MQSQFYKILKMQKYIIHSKVWVLTSSGTEGLGPELGEVYIQVDNFVYVWIVSSDVVLVFGIVYLFAKESPKLLEVFRAILNKEH